MRFLLLVGSHEKGEDEGEKGRGQGQLVFFSISIFGGGKATLETFS